MHAPSAVSGILNANISLGRLTVLDGRHARFGVDDPTLTVPKGTKVTLISRPVFAVDSGNQTIQIVKVRLQVGKLILQDAWIPLARFEFV